MTAENIQLTDQQLRAKFRNDAEGAQRDKVNGRGGQAGYGPSKTGRVGASSGSGSGEHLPYGADIGSLIAQSQGDPRVMKMIQAILQAQTMGPRNAYASDQFGKMQAAFNPPGADPRPQTGNVAHGSRGGAMKMGTYGADGQRNPDYENRLADERSARNRQTTLNQDYDQEGRMNQLKLSILQKLQGGYGRSNMTNQTRVRDSQQVFNNAGAPQIVPIHETETMSQGFSPQDILSLFR